MQRYSPDFILRMSLGERAARVLNGRPFPGHVPTRTYIQMYRRDDTNRKIVFFSYNGKRSNSSYQQALRIKRRLEKQNVAFVETLIEYTPDTVIYSGGLTTGSRGTSFAAYYPTYPIQERLNLVAYPKTRQTVVRFRGRSFYYPSSDIPNVAAEAAWERIRTELTNRLRGLRG